MLGPVFSREFAITARRGRSYALRFAFGLALIAVLVAGFRSASGDGLDPGMISPTRVTWLAADSFHNLVLAQAIAVVFLTPAVVAGAIAGEAQRKTLGDLLTTDLTDAEIVLGKLAARLLHIVVIVATGLPVLLFTGLLGGIGLPLVLLAEAATLSMAFFLGGLSILGSTQTRSVRGALNFVFTLALAWLILPAAFDVMMPRQGMVGLRLWEWLAPFNAAVAPSTPFALWVDLTRGSIRAPGALEARVLGMVGLQVLYGSIMAALAVVTLRPSFRARSGSRGHRMVARSRRLCRPQRRVPCGDDPMLWKELFAARVPAAYRPLGLTIALVLGALLIWGTTDFAMPAFRELWSAGYGVAPPRSARGAFHDYLRIVCTGTYLIFALGVASDAAAGLTTEREKETWISLIATPLTGTEIVRAKLLGAIWGIRHVGLILAMLGFVGVLAGSVHPLGIILVFFELAAFIWFAAALGTWISLRSKDTMRAVALTMGWLLLANGGSLLLALALLPSRALATVGCTPLMIALSLASPGEVAGRVATGSPALFTHAAFAMLWGTHRTETVIACILSVLGYGAAAWALTRAACRGFDVQVDRPAMLGSEAGEATRSGSKPRPTARSLRKATSSARS